MLPSLKVGRYSIQPMTVNFGAGNSAPGSGRYPNWWSWKEPAQVVLASFKLRRCLVSNALWQKQDQSQARPGFSLLDEYVKCDEPVTTTVSESTGSLAWLTAELLNLTLQL